MPFDFIDDKLVYDVPEAQSENNIKYLKLTDEIHDLNDSISKNDELIEELYSRKFNQTSAYHFIAEIPQSIIDMLTAIRDILANGVMGKIQYYQDTVDGTIGMVQTLSSENFMKDSLATVSHILLQQLMTYVQPIADLPMQFGLPPLPLMEEIPKALELFSKLGAAISRLPPEIQNKIKQDRENNKTSFKDKFKLPPKVKNTIQDIVDSIKQAIEEWKDFITTFYRECFLALLNLLDTVFQFFGITPGFPLNMIEVVEKVAKTIAEYSKNSTKLLWDLVIDKVMEPIYAVKYLANADISSDYIISSLMCENISSEISISATYAEMDVIRYESEIEDITENIDYYSNLQAESEDENEYKDAENLLPLLNKDLQNVKIQKITAEENLKIFSEISGQIIDQLKSQISIKQPPPGV